MFEHDFQPNWMTAPGDTIADILSQKKISVSKFARLMGLSSTEVDKLLKGRAAITIDIARSLEKVLGGSFKFWMSREFQFRDDVAHLQKSGSLDAIRTWLGELPVTDMKTFGWIKAAETPEGKLAACLSFFDVSSVSEWRNTYKEALSVVSFRTSPTFESQPGSVIAWLRYGELQSTSIKCASWDPTKFRNALPSIRRLTRKKRPIDFVPELRRICAECGVAIVIARAPSGCRASGATRFLTSNKAMILLSFRYRSDDQFWFTFFHEAGHLILHNKKALFLEDGSDVALHEEDEANRFAEEILIPTSRREVLPVGQISMLEIVRAAVKLDLARGIVVGQLQHMKRIPSDKFNWMKNRYEWDQVMDVISEMG